MEEGCGDARKPGAGLADNLPGLRYEADVAGVRVDVNLVRLGVEGARGRGAVRFWRVLTSLVDMVPNRSGSWGGATRCPKWSRLC